MAHNSQLSRQWNLLRTLPTRGEGVSLSRLAADSVVSERTIQRDLEMLQEQDFPLEYEKDAYGKRFWRLPRDFFSTGGLALSLTEAISLHLAERIMIPLSGTCLSEGLQTVLEKVRRLVPKRALDYFSALDETIYVRRIGLTNYSGFTDTIRTLVDGAREIETVTVRYRAIWRGDEYTTRFDPYGLVYYDGDLFVVGHSHRAKAIRIFKVTRVVSAKGTNDGFDRPADFVLEDHFRSSFGIYHTVGEPVEITVRFTGVAAALVEERIWHESQQLSWQPAEETLFEPLEGAPETLAATFRLSGVVEFKRWIKGFGDQAEIIQPPWLRDELGEELLAAAKRHGA